MKKKICIICCCYNEEGNIPTLYRELLRVTGPLNRYDWEFLFEDNCSTDGTVDILRRLAAEDGRVKVILNQANYGVDRSGSNALMAPCADAIISMASDLEDPPDLIPQFVESWENGSQVVMGQYTTRQENPVIHACRSLYYKIIAAFSDVKLENNVTGFGLYDMSVIDRIRELDEYNILLRFLCSELGYTIKYIPFDKPKRKKGKSSYSLIKYYRFAVDTLVLTSHVPLHLASFTGFVIAILSVFVALYFFIMKLVHWYTFDLGLAPIMIGIFFLGGVQLFFIGVIGEYLSSAIHRVTKRPFVIEKERLNFENYGKPGKPTDEDTEA